MIRFLKNLLKSKTETFKDKTNFKELVSKKEVQELFKLINSYSNESEVRFVGGCVRKLINNEVVDDIDLSTNLRPEKVIEILKNYNINFYETGINHGTVTAVINDKSFEITSLRKDIKTDGRHAQVEYTKDWLDDASRRDFTINAIYSDKDGNLFDPYNGKNDLIDGAIKNGGALPRHFLENRILRRQRFIQTYLR